MCNTWIRLGQRRFQWDGKGVARVTLQAWKRRGCAASEAPAKPTGWPQHSPLYPPFTPTKETETVKYCLLWQRNTEEAKAGVQCVIPSPSHPILQPWLCTALGQSLSLWDALSWLPRSEWGAFFLCRCIPALRVLACAPVCILSFKPGEHAVLSSPPLSSQGPPHTLTAL